MDNKTRMIPEERAMEMLRMKRSLLRSLARSADLQCHRSKNSMYYSLAEIEKMAQARSRTFQDEVVLPERVELLQLEVRRLHRLMRNIAHVLGFVHAFWEPTDAELYGAYEKANALLNRYGANKAPSEHMVNTFLAVVSRLTEHEFRRMHNRYRNDAHPWRPFWQVCEQMLHALHTKSVANLDQDNSALRHRIYLCIDVLRRGIYVYCALVRPDQDFRRTMSEALNCPGQSIADIEMAQMQSEDPDFCNPSEAFARFNED